MADEENSQPRNPGDTLAMKLSGLEKKAVALEREYDVLLRRAEQIETWTDRYSASMERERKVVAIIELLMRHDNKSRLLLHHVTAFFQLVLNKLRRHGLQLASVRELWYKLEEEAVSAAFDDVVCRLGFHGNELAAIRLVLDVVHDKHPSTCTCMTSRERELPLDSSAGGGDGEVVGLILFLQVQDELDTGIRLALRRAIAVSHCSHMPDSMAPTGLDRVVSPRFLEQLNELRLTSTPPPLRPIKPVDVFTSASATSGLCSAGEPVRLTEHQASTASQSSCTDEDENMPVKDSLLNRCHDVKTIPDKDVLGCCGAVFDGSPHVEYTQGTPVPSQLSPPTRDLPWAPVDRGPPVSTAGNEAAVWGEGVLFFKCSDTVTALAGSGLNRMEEEENREEPCVDHLNIWNDLDSTRDSCPDDVLDDKPGQVSSDDDNDEGYPEGRVLVSPRLIN